MNSHEIIDLRSDTVTKPSATLREIMASAEVGDDVYGEDPTINALEALAAKITGKQAGLYVPSGSQANVIAQMVHVVAGEEVIAGKASHCIRYEAGGGASLAGSQYSVVEGSGLFTIDDVLARWSQQTLHNPGTCLVWMENTHNIGGGLVFPIDQMRQISTLCKKRGVPIHVDGARIFNASVASGVAVAEYGSVTDSLSFCLSKGLGAPVGSLLCGTTEFIDKARRMRKRVGGGMRQAGILAAAGIHVLENNVERLVEDHDNARLIADRLDAAEGISVDMESVQTNIVMADVETTSAPEYSAACKSRGVLFHPLTEKRIRLVTHMDVSTSRIQRALDTMIEVLGK